MSYVRKRSRRFWLPLSVVTALCVAVAMFAATSSIGATKASTIKIGFISTCKGPFAPFYDATLRSNLVYSMPISAATFLIEPPGARTRLAASTIVACLALSNSNWPVTLL